MYLSVIIPAYNEEKRLPKTLTEIDKYLSRQSYESEVIVVDGSSTDRTSEVVQEISSKIKSLKLLQMKNCQGKGQAVRDAMLASSGQFRIFTDADNSTTIDQVEKMWPFFQQGYDIVIGSRDVKGAVLDPPQPFLRKVILGAGFKLLRKLIIDLWGLADTQCGFKCFTQKAAEDLFPRIKILGFSFDAEILVLAKKFGYKIKEMPIVWKNDLESKVKFKSVIEMFFELWQIRKNLTARKYDQQKKS
jgi:dolichyl-phosphate beta-glucosyltransferase